MYEMKSLTLNGKKYDSFIDQTAREAIEEIEKNGTGGTVTDEQIADAVEDYMAEHPIEVPDSSQNVNYVREILPNVVLFGDSITDTAVNGEWVKNIEDYAEFKSLTNYARGWCTFTFKSDSEYNITDTSNANIGNNVIWNQYNRMKVDVDSGAIEVPDCIIILGGTNDALYALTIGDKDAAFTGSILDADVKTLTNLYQSIRYVCETIKNEFPSTQIILCTPLQLGNSSNNNVISVHDAIVDSARKMALKYIDQTYESGVYSYDEITGNVKLQGDNVHLSTLGGKLVAQFLGREFYNKINLRYTKTTDEEDDPIEPEATLSSISATYNGGSVSVGTELSALTGITVTANYSDGGKETVTGYVLSGTITEGSNTITVTYEGLTTTFTVIGVREETPVTLVSIGANYTGGEVEAGTQITALTGVTVTGTWSDGSTSAITGYTLTGDIAEGENVITVTYGGLTTTFTVTGLAENPVIPEEPMLLYSLETPFTGNGTDSYVDTGIALTDVDRDYTIFVGYEATSVKTYDCLVSTMMNKDPYDGIFVGNNISGNKLSYGNGKKDNDTATNKAWSLTELAYLGSKKIAVTHEKGTGTVKIYLNSVEQMTSYGTHTTLTDNTLVIGAQRNSTGGFTSHMTGTISECNIYNYVLSASEIESLFRITKHEPGT